MKNAAPALQLACNASEGSNFLRNVYIGGALDQKEVLE